MKSKHMKQKTKQFLDNEKNFWYNDDMRKYEELEEIALQVVALEKKCQKKGMSEEKMEEEVMKMLRLANISFTELLYIDRYIEDNELL